MQHEVKRASARGVVVAARLGYLTHGIIYGLVGALALLTALGQAGGRITGGEGAVRHIGRTAWGEPLLYAVALGMLCYALWTAVRALLDPEHHGRDGSALLKRLGYGISAVSHAFLGLYAFELAARGGASGGHKDESIVELLSLPGGRIVLGMVGLGVIAYGLVEIYRALTDDVAAELNGSSVPARHHVHTIARVGVAARGTVFPIIGASLLIAALKARSSEAQTFGEALHELVTQPFGTWLLGVVAAGLVAYGVYMLVLARYAQLPRAL
jgi:Domain of Unknown Function (DUF1206)